MDKITINSNFIFQGFSPLEDFDVVQTNLVKNKKDSLFYRKIKVDLENTDTKDKISVSASGTFENYLYQSTHFLDHQKKIKKSNVNCYSFAIARVPFSKNVKDPIPGGVFIEGLRLKCISFFKEKGQSEISNIFRTNKSFIKGTNAEILKHLFLAEQELFCYKNNEFLKIENHLKQDFNQEVFNKRVSLKSQISIDLFREMISFISDKIEEKNYLKFFVETFGYEQFKYFLTESYRVPSDNMDVKTIEYLLKVDGLIPCSEMKGGNESLFGDLFIAAFLDEKGDKDYHFIRLLNDGWYERSGNKIIKREADVQNRTNDQHKTFVGFFFVPTTISVVDEIGQKFIFESIDYQNNF